MGVVIRSRAAPNGVVELLPSRQSPAIESARGIPIVRAAMNRMPMPPTVSLTARHLLTSSAVMALFGYRNRSAFWDFVRRDGVPHIRFNQRRIMFEEQALNDWLARRSSRRW